ncbi:hypothetical protein [Shouchella lonarensis]|uniref:Uncharacterized protein n=1 Tax=Shouchella lonarensis TaxID=1464122 RepID=A0A1G6JW10_9BACI|nr:hypothetical protein [Shouchella lonarensis]SDC22942.1 hypothetical protein SAMN05421737_106111 [Shouchella lonarensis]
MKRKQTKEDCDGRACYEMDVDRYINEGLSGGRVDPHSGGLIEESLSLKEEEPPAKS